MDVVVIACFVDDRAYGIVFLLKKSILDKKQ